MKNISAVLALGLTLAACGPKPADDAQKSDQDYAARMAQEHRNDVPTASPAASQKPGAPIKSQTVTYATIAGQDINGYLAYPAQAEGGLPGVLVFHEWWGLNDNIKSMADRLAAQGYVALAADLYRGRVADNPDTARAYMEAALKDSAALSQNLRQAHAFLKDEIKATRVASIGWCFGGSVSLKAALQLPDQLDAAVIYYGHVHADPEQLKPLKAPILGLFGGADQGIPVEGVREFEAALKSLGKSAEIHIYENAGHAFANPSGGNYKADAAEDAWMRSLEFLATHLKGG